MDKFRLICIRNRVLVLMNLAVVAMMALALGGSILNSLVAFCVLCKAKEIAGAMLWIAKNCDQMRRIAPQEWRDIIEAWIVSWVVAWAVVGCVWLCVWAGLRYVGA